MADHRPENPSNNRPPQRRINRSAARGASVPSAAPSAPAQQTPREAQRETPRSGEPRRSAAQKRPAPKAQPPRRPARKAPRRRRRRWLPVVCLLCLLAAVAVSVVVVRLNADSGSPAQPDFGTAAAAWQKNELGYYFNASGQAMPAAVLKGIDVSKYQGEVDWEKAKAAGIDFAVIRCGFGGEWDGTSDGWNQDDPQWRRNADECTRLGIPFGVYLYSYATSVEDARSEADHVARLLGLTAAPYEALDDYTETPYTLSYPVYYDLEDKSISSIFPDEMAEIVQAFFDRLAEYGYAGEQGIYASLNWVRARFSDEAFDPWRENLWIARFSDELGYTGAYDMWQCSYQAAGADYGVQSDTVDINFVMRPFAFTGLSDGIGKAADPTFVNDTRQYELHLDAEDARATLTTNQPAEADGGQKIYWQTSDKTVATVDKHGTVRARTDSGECTITATLADGTESLSCVVRVGDITVPVFVTAGLQGDRSMLADVAARKASTPDAILLDAGGSLHGTESASMTGGMDMFSAFSAAGYDLQAVGAWDLAYGTSRLQSDVVMGAGSSLASNLRDTDATAILYRTTSWNRNRITNGMNTVIERAGRKIGFFVLNDPDLVNGTISAANGEFVTARDWTETATEQIAALQADGADAIVCIAATAPSGNDWQKALLDAGVDAIIDGTATQSENSRVLAADLGQNGVAQLALTFAQGGGCTVQTAEPITAAQLSADRATWDSLNAESTQTADTVADADAETSADDPGAPTERADEAPQKGASAYASTAAALAELDTDDQSIWYTALFTYAENTDADKTISFGNYLAALYTEIVENDTGKTLPEGAVVTALAGNYTEPEYGEITRGDLLNCLPTAARLQLISTTAEAAQTLAAGEGVTRIYPDSLTEYAPEGDTVYLVTDTLTAQGLGEGSYTVLRDYGDVFWAVRMNINDLTNNFADLFILPDAPTYGTGRNR